jgi:general secretion pathway protein C
VETFFRKYFWTVTLLWIVATAFLSARVVNSFVAASIATPPSIEAPFSAAAAQALPGASERAPLEPLRVASLFGVQPPKPEEPSAPVAADVPPPFDPNAAAVKSGLRAQVAGTMVANRAQWSLSAITDLNVQETRIYGVGDRLMGVAEVWAIERKRVLVKKDNRLEYLDFEPGTGDGSPSFTAAAVPNLGTASMPAPNVTPGPVASATAGGEGVRQVSDTQYIVSKQELDSTLSNLSNVATQARIVPSFKNGVANGFKLFSIRPGSIYAKIGVQNGDVIRRINGYDINSPEKALEIYQRLREACRVELELERRGQNQKKTYDIEGCR